MKNSKWFVIGAILLLAFCISWSKSTDFSQDLGRHLKLGEIIVKTGRVPATNLFSYTNSGFPFVNHHWLSEVIFYLLVTSFGLGALQVLRFLLVAGTILLSLLGKRRNSQYMGAAITSLLIFPLLSQRIGIRPELFGYFFFSLLIYLIFFQDNDRLLIIIPIVMLLWVNLHITFVFGLMLLGIGFIRSLKLKKSVIWYIAGILVLLINPNGVYGAVEPFIIFKNYGYAIVENQNLFLINSLTVNPGLRYYLFLIPILVYAAAILLVKKQYWESFIIAFFYGLGLWQIRHIPFLAIAALFIVSHAFAYALVDAKRISIIGRYKKIVPLIILATFIIEILFTVSNFSSFIFDNQTVFGYGFYESQKDATDFVMQNRLPGHLFNNFDIGGYAIYRLYPQYKVFVDNRPEAYPADFFQNVYIPLQEDDEFRKKIFQQYDIHIVLFSHTDATPWGRSFMQHVLSDPSWKLLYVNSEIMVMSDKTILPDVRTNTAVLQEHIDDLSDPVSLLHFASFLSFMNEDTLTQKSILKIKQINPYSCSLKRFDYERQIASNFATGFGAEKAWWCY